MSKYEEVPKFQVFLGSYQRTLDIFYGTWHQTPYFTGQWIVGENGRGKVPQRGRKQVQAEIHFTIKVHALLIDLITDLPLSVLLQCSSSSFVQVSEAAKLLSR